MTPRPRVAVLPGDDAAPEAVAATLQVLQAAEPPVEWELLPAGDEMARDLARAEAERLVREAADRCDTVLFGATSGQTPGVGYLRWGKETYANVRPIRWQPGYRSPLANPEGIDYVIVRENLEDLYLGLEGDLAALVDSGLATRPPFQPQLDLQGREGRYAIKVLTRVNTERVAHFACRLAQRRLAQGHAGLVTTAAKTNVLRRSDGYFCRVVEEVVAQYPELRFEAFIADDFARRLVATPQAFDVIVLPNLYGDIFSDEGAGTIGGLGLAPSGCYGDAWAYFESVHGTAPDIAGRGVINPTATLLSAALMLEHLGLEDTARRIERAVTATYAAGDRLTPDQGGSAGTEEFARAVTERL